MPKTFQIIEPSASKETKNPFGVGAEGVPLFECARLLCGSVDLKKRSDGETVRLRDCHIRQVKARAKKHVSRDIINILFDGDLTEDDADTFLRKSARENLKFWEELRGELCFCLYWRSKGRHVEAFLHTYRILELISVAIPLVYASRIADFREAIKFIKALSKNDRDGDLAILRYFSEEISKNATYARLSVDFPFSGIPAEVHSELAGQIDRWVLSERVIDGELLDPVSDGVRVKFSSVSSYIASCRNRLFHNALSNDNFKVDALQGPEAICKMIVDPALYWFGFVFVEIIKAQAERYV